MIGADLLDNGSLVNIFGRTDGAVRLVAMPAGFGPFERCDPTTCTLGGCGPGLDGRIGYHAIPHVALLAAAKAARDLRAVEDAALDYERKAAVVKILVRAGVAATDPNMVAAVARAQIADDTAQEMAKKI